MINSFYMKIKNALSYL